MIEAIIGTIGAGTSIASTANSFNSMDFSVTFSLETENYTDKHLSHHNSPTKSGLVTIPPTSIKPGEKESMAGHKTDGSATGSYGTVSWKIGNTEMLLVVMYSVPFDHNFHHNWLAVGVFDKKKTQANADVMYYNEETEFKRKRFWDDTNPVIYDGNADYLVEGSMGSDYKAVIKVKSISNFLMTFF